MNDDRIYPWLEPQWHHLVEQHAQGRLPHALLLSGPAGVGKGRLRGSPGPSAALPCPPGGQTLWPLPQL